MYVMNQLYREIVHRWWIVYRASKLDVTFVIIFAQLMVVVPSIMYGSAPAMVIIVLEEILNIAAIIPNVIGAAPKENV